ncbi:MAG: hypothetical protein AAB383_06625 [Patescibacteria group bacterium]|mgnify:CR=1 FL=1
MNPESNDRKPWTYNPKIWESTPETAEIDAAIASVSESVGDIEYFVQPGVCTRSRVPISATEFYTGTARWRS